MKNYEDMSREELIAECERLYKMAYFSVKLPRGLKWLANS